MEGIEGEDDRRESYASFFLVGNLSKWMIIIMEGRERERNREDILITVEIFDILSKDEMMEQFLFSCVSGPYLIILSIIH